MTGLPFALVVLLILVWAICLLIGTLASQDDSDGPELWKVRGAGVDLPGISLVDIDRWIRAGLLRLSMPGSGRRRRYPIKEVRAALALDSLRRLGGARGSINGCAGAPGAGRQLQHDVAQAARSNPPGTVVELETGPAWLRVVVVVPEP